MNNRLDNLHYMASKRLIWIRERVKYILPRWRNTHNTPINSILIRIILPLININRVYNLPIRTKNLKIRPLTLPLEQITNIRFILYKEKLMQQLISLHKLQLRVIILRQHNDRGLLIHPINILLPKIKQVIHRLNRVILRNLINKPNFLGINLKNMLFLMILSRL